MTRQKDFLDDCCDFMSDYNEHCVKYNGPMHGMIALALTHGHRIKTIHLKDGSDLEYNTNIRMGIYGTSKQTIIITSDGDLINVSEVALVSFYPRNAEHGATETRDDVDKKVETDDNESSSSLLSGYFD